MIKSRIILVGKGAAGKDYARTILTDVVGMKYGVSYTTRPPRKNEVNGEDYNFISEEDFMGMDLLDEWFEWVNFNGWMYGTTNDQFHGDCTVFIMTPEGLSHLATEDRDESLVVYFDIDASVREQRMSERKANADSIHRRLKADEQDFMNFDDFDILVTDPHYTDQDIVSITRRFLASKTVQKV